MLAVLAGLATLRCPSLLAQHHMSSSAHLHHHPPRRAMLYVPGGCCAVACAPQLVSCTASLLNTLLCCVHRGDGEKAAKGVGGWRALALLVQFCGWPALCALGAGERLVPGGMPANATHMCAAAAAPQTPAPSCQQGPSKQETVLKSGRHTAPTTHVLYPHCPRCH